MSPTDYLAHSADSSSHPTPPAFSFTAPELRHGGEWHAPDMSQFTAPYLEQDNGYSSATATSDSCLTSASTAISAPMTRCNTNDQICESFDMFHMDPTGSYPGGLHKDMPTSLSVTSSVHQFPYSHLVPDYQDVSFSPVVMKPSLSQDSVSSSSSESISSQSVSSDSAMQPMAQAKPRALAPKRQNDASKQPAMPKLVAVKDADGTIKQKAEITRAARPPQQRKTTFCDFCNDQPQGFHGDHELRRHIERQHTHYRKVWICRDISEDSTFLRNCKACRNRKTYGANYNAAAHLRRTHFNPCKNKRGGRGKKSEGRGGMGGGNSPSMEELKKWMYETYEVNLNGRVIVQSLPPDAEMPQVPMSEIAAYQHPMVGDNIEFGGVDGLMDGQEHYNGPYPDPSFITSGMHAYPQMIPHGYAVQQMPVGIQYHDGPQYM